MNARIVRLCHAFLLAGSSLAAAQAPGAPPSAPAFTEADNAFAHALVAMTPEQAAAAISNAAPSQLTAGAAIALRTIGNSVIVKQPLVALAIYQKSIQIADALHLPLIVAPALQNQGNAYRALANPEAALDAYDRSLAAYEAGEAGPADFCRVFNARGLQRKDLGDIDGAIEDGRHAMDDCQQAHDDVGLARNLNNLGNAERIAGHVADARQHYEWGLRLARAQKQRLGEAFLLNNIADTYLEQDNPELAIDYCLQSIRMKEELGNKDDIANSLLNLARIYHASRHETEARQTLDRAMTSARDSGRSSLIINVLLEQGILELGDKSYAASMERLQEALTLARKAGARFQELEVLTQIASVELGMKHDNDAAHDAEAAMALADQMGYQEDLAIAALTAGRAQRELGNIVQSCNDFKTSIAAIEFLRDNIAGGDQARSEFFARRGEPYQEFVSLSVSQGKAEDALLISEHEKGRALLDLLTQGKVNLADQLTPGETSEEKHLRARLASLESKRSASLMSDSPALTALHQQTTAAHNAISTFNERMYAAHPQLSRHRGDAPLITLQQTAKLLSKSTAIIEYEVTPSATYLFTITSGTDAPTLHVYTLPITAAALKARVTNFRSAIATRDPDFAASAVSLYRLLLASAKADLAGKRNLIIVPSADLWHLPFQALQTSSGKYLIESAAISYVPSLSVLHAYSLQQHSPEATHTLLAFGDPAGDMPEADREVQTLAGIYGTPHTRSFTGAAATTSNFHTYAARYDIVHLATHGVVDSHNPMYSHLVFASTQSASPQTKLTQLNASEIAQTNLSASLVVLSACETADGKYQDGEGLIGLTSAFLAAGSQSAVASQWRVESSSTTELMIALHRGLQQHLSKAEALRQAELTVAHEPRYRHPFYWAGFVLLGEN